MRCILMCITRHKIYFYNALHIKAVSKMLPFIDLIVKFVMAVIFM